MIHGGDGGEKMDRRTRKTKKAIKSAFMDLASKDDMKKITVTDISHLADINRKTFYAYYNDVSAVIDDIENEMIGNFLSLISDYDIDKFISNPYPVFQQLTSFINEDADFYCRFLSANNAGAMLEKIKAVIKEKLLVFFKNDASVNGALLGYTIDYSLGGLIAAYREWLNSNRKISLEDLSKHLSLITSRGLQSVLS